MERKDGMYAVSAQARHEVKKMAWHTKTAAEALRELNTDAGKGLSSAQARRRLEQYGKNQLEEGKKKAFHANFSSNFPILW